jgi:hypothetical protein
MTLLIIVILFVIFFGGGGYAWYGPGRTAPGYAPYGLGGIFFLFFFLMWLFLSHIL